MNHYDLEFSPRLLMLWKQSHLEEGCAVAPNPPNKGKDVPAIYPRSFVNLVSDLPKDKIYDYCFRGALYIDETTLLNRSWIIDFAKKHFSQKSYFQITDSNARKKTLYVFKRHKVLGSFDYTFKKIGFTPKEHPVSERGYFDHDYFLLMKQSKFTLCPAGDAPWSMRFQEAILSKSIPIVENPSHTGRNCAERLIGYHFYTTQENNYEYREDWAESNYDKFIRHQTLLKPI